MIINIELTKTVHMKLPALLVNNARHLEYKVTASGINSVAYESEFTHSISELKNRKRSTKGQILLHQNQRRD